MAQADEAQDQVATEVADGGDWDDEVDLILSAPNC